MAQVYAALVRGPFATTKLVAVKRIRDVLACDPTYVEMFVAEARLATRLTHPNIIQAYEVGEDCGQPFVSMELVDGISYGAARKARVLPLAAHVRILIDVLAALEHAHGLTDLGGAPLGVVHRDVSPSNLLIAWNGAVKLIDFGIATAMPGGRLVGKLSYMSPEQARCEEIDRRSDIFSVGVLLWEAITGRRLVDPGAPRIEAYDLIASGRVLDVARVPPDLPASLAAICRRALAARREDRFSTAAEMAAALEAYLAATDPFMTPRRIGGILASAFASTRTETARRRADAVGRILRGEEETRALVAVSEDGPRSTAPHSIPIATRTSNGSSGWAIGMVAFTIAAAAAFAATSKPPSRAAAGAPFAAPSVASAPAPVRSSEPTREVPSKAATAPSSAPSTARAPPARMPPPAPKRAPLGLDGDNPYAP
jgi:serine/threonine-protein kinase